MTWYDKLERRFGNLYIPNLMIGVVLDAGTARAVAEDCLQNGLLILTAKTLLRLLPPLNITREELDKGLSILESVLERIEDQ